MADKNDRLPAEEGASYDRHSRRPRLAFMFALVLTLGLLVTVAVYSVVNNAIQFDHSEGKALQDARLLNQQMTAAWDYIDAMQDYINYDADGSYNFKGVYCAVAGRAIARRFTLATDYTIRYVREDPRTGSDEPDEFERRALASFDDGQSEYYEVTDYDGAQSFRYVAALRITYGCLSCHGEPAGELDDVGYPKEGMHMGDLAGAVSIAVPMLPYQIEASSRTATDVLLFIVLAVAIVAIASISLHAWVTRPLGRLSQATHLLASGTFLPTATSADASREIAGLAADFDNMAAQLDRSYAHLEEQVAERTSQLTEANAELSLQRDEIARMNDRLVEANELLQQENEYKSTFLATMSHELRTPLASIIAYTDTWLKAANDKDSQDRALMSEIRRNGTSLLATINNTLDAASIEAHRYGIDIVETDLIDLANEVESVVEPLARERGVLLRLDVDPLVPVIATDPSIIHKILINLLGNAVKFTDAGGSIDLVVHVENATPATRPTIVLTVSDTGIGIPADDLDLIFERFRQADSSTSRKYGGSGLGLSLVKDMAELLGGTVGVQSEPGKGSTFTVRIPCTLIEEE